MRRPKAVILDMDGLMLDTEPIYRRAWKSAARELGFSLSDDLYEEMVGLTMADSEARLARAFGAAFSLLTFRALASHRWRREVRESGVPRKPGLDELLRALETLSLPSAIATSSDAERARISLGAAGLADRFECVVTGDDVTRGKPAPDLFLEAARRVQVAAESCLAVEDSEAGVLAASRAGMTVLLVPDLVGPSPRAIAASEAVYPSLHEVAAALTGAR